MLFTKSEIIVLAITGIEAAVLTIGMNKIRKSGKEELEKIYGTGDIDEIMKMTAEEAKKKGFVH